MTDVEPDTRPEAERLRERLAAAYAAMRLLGREKRALATEVRALRARLAEAEER